MHDSVLYDRRGQVAILTLNRPEHRNAIDPSVTARMHELLTAFEDDDDARVGVVTGAGKIAFSAGADLKAIEDGRLSEIVNPTLGGFAGIVTAERRKPLIAAVNGAALAGGFEIALACDMVVAADHASFGLPEVRVGLIAGAGGLQRLARRIPPARAYELVLTGRAISAVEASALGLVNTVVSASHLLESALELAEAIAANAPIAVEESRGVIATTVRQTEQAAWERVETAWRRVLASSDAKEGPRAFLEGRQPVWKGR